MKKVLSSLKLVFKKPLYLVLATGVILILLVINALLPQRGLIAFIFQSENFAWSVRLKIIKNLLLNIGANMTMGNKILFVVIIFLAGISIALLVYYIKRRLSLSLESGASLTGIILSLIGIGCAACGSVILSSVFGLSATVAFVGFLPLQGLELGLFSLVLLSWSIYSISKKIDKQIICKIPEH